MKTYSTKSLLIAIAIAILMAATTASAQEFGPWSTPANLGPIVNSACNDMHPTLSKDALSVIFSSDRPPNPRHPCLAALHLWVSQRDSLDGYTSQIHEFSAAARLADGTVSGQAAAPKEDNDEATFTTIDPPGAGATFPQGITPGGDIVGRYEHEHNRCPQRHFGQFSDWSEPVNLGPVVNSEFNDQHPAISADGLSLYVTSDRPGGFGDFDIYVSHRASVNDEWGPPQNLGPIINTEFEDSVPTFSRDGHRMYFESGRPGGYGGNDIWVSFREDTTDDFAWQPAANLGRGVNTKTWEGGPTLFEDRRTGITTLYFTRCVSGPPCGFGDPNEKWDIYASVMNEDGTFGTAVPVPELNSGYRDTRTAIRSDGLELILTSSRPGGFGGIDLWVSTRESTDDPWTEPKNLGPIINSKYKEGAPALSCDARTLYFYSNRPGGFGNNDLYVTTRQRLHHEEDDDDDAQE